MIEAEPLSPDEIKRLMDFTAVECASPLSEEEKDKAASLIEADMLVRPQRGKRLNKELIENRLAIEILKGWSFWSNDYHEICKLSGKSKDSWLGDIVKQKNKEKITDDTRNNQCFTHEQMLHVDGVISQLTRKSKQAINWQYVQRMSMKDKLSRMSIPKRTYYNRLSAAHNEFIEAGGIGINSIDNGTVNP